MERDNDRPSVDASPASAEEPCFVSVPTSDSPYSAADPTAHIVELFQQGAEPSQVYRAIAEIAVHLTQAASAGLLVTSSDRSTELTPIFSLPGFIPEKTQTSPPTSIDKIVGHHEGQVRHYGSIGYLTIPALSLESEIGQLVVMTPKNTSAQAFAHLTTCARWLAIVSERQRLTSTVQHFLDRLQVLNQLTNLVASNAGFTSMLRSITREGALRFGADLALILILGESTGELQLLREGVFGCAPHSLPQFFSTYDGVLQQVLNLGGHIAVQNLSMSTDHGLESLFEQGITAVDLHCLEVRGSPVGVIILGSRREQTITGDEQSAFEEFTQAAAVALANARTQQQIQEYSEKLESLVDQRTQELERQKALAEDANHTKSQFLANMSHELRTPLTAIIGYSSILKEGIFGPCNERQLEAVSAIAQSSDHLKQLIDDVLNLARVESGKEDPEPRNIRIQDLLMQSYKLMMQTAINKGVHLEQPLLKAPLNEVAILADPKHTQQILINLMSNAVKYTPRDGKVTLSVEVVVDKLRINIRDTGVGIPPHKQATLFERFERGDDTYSKTQEGTGIGLNLTKRLVELNGGRIGVESVEGSGSTFYFMLPIAQDDAEDMLLAGADANSARASLDGLTLMVVDDNKINCDILSTILSQAGASVHVAHSVKEGMSILSTTTPDIILTDLAMPKESGLVLIQNVRGGESCQGDIPIIVLSACAFNADREAALGAGANMFIPKPFNPKEVLQGVRDLTLGRALSS